MPRDPNTAVIPVQADASLSLEAKSKKHKKLAGASFLGSALCSLLVVIPRFIHSSTPSPTRYSTGFHVYEADYTCPPAHPVQTPLVDSLCGAAQAVCSNVTSVVVNGTVPFVYDQLHMIADCATTVVKAGADSVMPTTIAGGVFAGAFLVFGTVCAVQSSETAKDKIRGACGAVVSAPGNLYGFVKGLCKKSDADKPTEESLLNAGYIAATVESKGARSFAVQTLLQKEAGTDVMTPR